MSQLDLDRVAPQAIPGVRIVPVVHQRVELAAVVRQVLEVVEPAVVAVELPTPLAAAVRRGVARLPAISLVISETADDDPLVWPVTPGDPLVEALRWAAERGRTTVFIDPDVPYLERHRDPVPDPYAVWQATPEWYLERLTAASPPEAESAADDLRERGMAHHLLAARREAGAEDAVVAVVGAAHARRVAGHLRRPDAAPLARVRRSTVELRHLAPDSLTALLLDPPLAHAVWEEVRSGTLPPPLPSPPSRSTAGRGGLTVVAGGRQEEGERRHQLVRRAAREAVARWPGGPPVPDRRALATLVWRAAGAALEAAGEGPLYPWQGRLFFEFAHRYARLQGQLASGLFEWLVAARGVADDNLAWEVFEAARSYPWQEAAHDLPTVEIDGDELDLGTRKIRFRRRFFRVKRRRIRVPARPRRPGDRGAWGEALGLGGLCSFPPEDLVVEDVGRQLRRRAVSAVSAELRRSVPFAASLHDGVDVRETLRHLDSGQVWVREEGKVAGGAGSVVVIFDPDREKVRFPYRMTWLGEHDQESDMAFYSTLPGKDVVGPGILRATYGGFLMTVPPGRLDDVWRDPEYRPVRDKAATLLRAAVDYSLEELVVYVASSPPRGAERHYARRRGKRIVYLPLGALPRETLRRVRTFHILEGRDRREIAGDFIHR